MLTVASVCEYCDSTFAHRPSRARRFCSRTCASRGRGADKPGRVLRQALCAEPDVCAPSPLGSKVKGYSRFWCGGRNVLAHRWVYERVFGGLPYNIDVMHSCDNPDCINIFHLSAGTAADNMQDAVRKGRFGSASLVERGEQRWNAKLNAAAVEQIRSSTATGRELARQLGVGTSSISRVRRNQAWRHV